MSARAPRSSAACGAPTPARGPTSPSRTTARCSRPCSTPPAWAAGTRLLDVGCGTGLDARARRGARRRAGGHRRHARAARRSRASGSPDADLREGDMETLPWEDEAFDAVVGVNAFQFAGDPRRALAEAARVVRPGGRVVASLFAAPERSQSTVVHHAMQALIPPDRRGRARALRALGARQPRGRARGRRPARRRRRRGRLLVALRLDGGRDPRAALLRGRRAREGGRGRGRRARARSPRRSRRSSAAAIVNMDNTFRWVAASR